MTDFVLKILFKFNCKFYHQISGRVIGTKFAALYVHVSIGFFEMELSKRQDIKPCLWKRFNDTFFYFGQNPR